LNFQQITKIWQSYYSVCCVHNTAISTLEHLIGYYKPLQSLQINMKKSGDIKWRQYENNSQSWYRWCNDIVSYEFLWTRKTCDYI